MSKIRIYDSVLYTQVGSHSFVVPNTSELSMRYRDGEGLMVGVIICPKHSKSQHKVGDIIRVVLEKGQECIIEYLASMEGDDLLTNNPTYGDLEHKGDKDGTEGQE